MWIVSSKVVFHKRISQFIDVIDILLTVQVLRIYFRYRARHKPQFGWFKCELQQVVHIQAVAG